VEKLTKLTSKRSEIVLTSNGGYPLDQNLYQAVKSMNTASYVAKKGGVIITASSCIDGIGGEVFHRMLLHPEGPGKILEEIRATAPTDTDLDQWQVQILVRLLLDYKVIVVTEGVDPVILHAMGMDCATTLEEALAKANAYTSPDAKITVIPNGAGIFIESLD
jgi:nickel-dependent lactate racemase